MLYDFSGTPQHYSGKVNPETVGLRCRGHKSEISAERTTLLRHEGFQRPHRRGQYPESPPLVSKKRGLQVLAMGESMTAVNLGDPTFRSEKAEVMPTKQARWRTASPLQP